MFSKHIKLTLIFPHLKVLHASIFTFYAFSRRFYPKRLTIAFRLCIFISTCVPWESNPQPFALLTQCSTTEPHRNIFAPLILSILSSFLFSRSFYSLVLSILSFFLFSRSFYSLVLSILSFFLFSRPFYSLILSILSFFLHFHRLT